MERDLHARDRVGVQDSVLLENFSSEEAFIDNLEKRFKENLIYTYIGPVLVSVNPYKNLPIYGADYVEKYRNVHFFECPPHVFAVTDNALRSLRAERQDQCILISGESGAGKTEASKKVLQFIAATSRQKATVESVKDKLLNTNPLLEAFGNAKTNRNDNSSRFGKYMDVAFSHMGDPVGGNILNYLLEKSRVVYQASGERNFHIFYQLLAGTDNAHLEKLALKRDPKHYFYLNQGGNHELPSIDESAQFKTVEQAMKVIELGTEEQEAIWVLIAVILHLGNLVFQSDGGRAQLPNNETVKTIAKLLGCNANDLEKSLLNRTIEARGDVVVTPLDYEQAMYARDALSKATYARLFNWLVRRLNASLKAEHEGKTSVLGILDIYGFEIFQRNSFEQFCINYCNEKLQQLFIELTLKSEQEEYRREGIEWEPVEYFDNKIICDLVEEKHKGIIAVLDEECLRPGDASDLTFLSKMDEVLRSHPHYMSHSKADNKTKKTIERKEFRLLHYAGEVTYSVHGFLEKNNDLLFRDLKEVMISTQNLITKAVFEAGELQSKRRPDTAALQFKTSLAQLVEILVKKEPSYIRCIKPNESKHSGRFDRAIVGHQVKYLGLMENLRVRRAGFAYRRPYEAFLGRYKCLCPATWPHPVGPAKQNVQKLVDHLGYKKDEYRMGKTKIFIRLPKTLFDTEDAFQAKKHDLATLIQKVYKGKLQRRKYLKMRAAAIVIQAHIRRFLAQKAAKKRRWAVAVVRQFIKGFSARNEAPNEANKAFIRFVRYSYLMRLKNQLPQKVLDKSWPPAPLSCEKASQHLRVIHGKWLVRRYCTSISPPRKRQFELKVLAESLFQNKKANYPESVSQWFIDNRLSLEQQTLVKTNFECGPKPPSEKIVYCCPVVKYDRHGYTPRQRIVVLTDSALYVLDAKDAKVKHRFTLSAITALVITNMTDGLMLIRIPQDQKKDKGDLILGCDFLIEAVTKIVDTTKSSNILQIEDSSSISHQMVGGKQGTIEITRGNNLAYTKGKNGHLIIVAPS